MSTWSEPSLRGTVLRGGAAAAARPARMDVDLRDTPFAAGHVVDARLTDPHLQDVVERARQAAVSDGRAEGFAEGYAAGLAAAAAEAEERVRAHEAALAERAQAHEQSLQQAVALLTRAAQAFQQQEQVAVADVEDVVAELAVEVARAVLGREVLLSSDPGADALARALVLAPEGRPATARLHPEDLRTLTDVDALAQGRPLQLVADPAVARGGCVVESGGRTIDAQLEPALQRVAAVLR